jgi:N utilization substance protein A
MSNEIIQIFEYLENERGIDRETLIDLLKKSLREAARKSIQQTREIEVKFDERTGTFRCWAKLFVVDKITNPSEEILLSEARKINPAAVCGDEVACEVTPEDFGRIAAQAAKQTITMGLRQAEKRNVCESFKDHLNQLLNGIVVRIERGDIYINFGQAEGVLRSVDKIPGEIYDLGDHITVLLTSINPEGTGPSLYVSRVADDFVLRLFEREVAEISSGLVEIKGLARVPGCRSKIAVATTQPRIDPVGACVGLRGTRVKTIVRELGGEKIDIITWDKDIKVYVTNALKPAKLASLEVDEANGVIRVKVTEDQFSLSVGKKGQNVRLAANLTGWKIDISKVETQEVEEPCDFAEQVRRAIESMGAVPGIGLEAAELLVNNGFASIDGILAAEVDDIAALEGIGRERAKEIIEAAAASLEQ